MMALNKLWFLGKNGPQSMRSSMIDKMHNEWKNAKIAVHCKFTFFQGEIELERTDENVESHVHHQENENGSTGENGNKN